MGITTICSCDKCKTVVADATQLRRITLSIEPSAKYEYSPGNAYAIGHALFCSDCITELETKFGRFVVYYGSPERPADKLIELLREIFTELLEEQQ